MLTRGGAARRLDGLTSSRFERQTIVTRAQTSVTRGAEYGNEPVHDEPVAPSRQRATRVSGSLFVVGCVLLVIVAANLPNMAEWADRWGQVAVFLAFFLVMSIAGRWFWAGVDLVIARIRNR